MIFLSIINHSHDEMIINNKELPLIAKKYNITIKSNTKASAALINYTDKYNIQLIDESYGLGFGCNNNYIFSYLVESNQISDSDYFLVINPDVTITLENIKKLEKNVNKLAADIYTINLYHDINFTQPELSIKKFPTILGPIMGLISKKTRNDAYNKSTITKPTIIDWAAGSFLLFTKLAYEKLNGFSDKYFMYFEDVDICRRAKIKKMHLMYLPDIKAIHKGAFNNRKILSKHFRWYLASYFRYHLKNNQL
ncbi:glycosyltransferase family 2 protein [Photobacterium kishitanii]|uniref:glycosyltransferase family 2 protein n=1 Tax=Photobacterium kishitanii TaxID=318456 RepID=UPI000D160C53|nr:glycosyltransferase family 2 protein [Photobacterium kishitanii]PSV18355.1 dTDP-Rha--alpha-D-GlcNAc-pyrophosphate polyprenol alpha-3-L-rhamnosyltransferase [Photobacterium kishitanii]